MIERDPNIVQSGLSRAAGQVLRRSPVSVARNPAQLNDMHRAALAAVIESGPIPAVHGVVRWRIRSLPMDLRGISRRRRQADAEPRTARHGLNYRPAGIKCRR
jgi:hypothetical protein